MYWDNEICDGPRGECKQLAAENGRLRKELTQLTADRMDLDNARALFEDCKRLNAENERLREALRWRFPPEVPEPRQLVVFVKGEWVWCVQYTNMYSDDGDFHFYVGDKDDLIYLDEITAWYPVQPAPVSLGAVSS